jgi:hypothetical protein
MFYEITREMISVKENGRTRTMTRLEAVLYQMTSRALSGDPRSMRDFVQFSRIFELPESPEEVVPVLHERETAAFQSVLKRMQRMAHVSESDASSSNMSAEGKEDR